MPRQIDPSSDVAASSAELNPLLNPLLADHMGQWAEVYFTNPPETREEAVLGLLRELQEKNSHPEGRARVTLRPGAPASEARTAESRPASTITAIEEAAVQCSSCGRENPALHRFCGGCGAALNHDPLNHDALNHDALNYDALNHETNSERPQVTMSGDAVENNSDMRRAEVASETARETGIDEIRAKLDPQRREFEDSVAHPGELSLFRSFREKDSSDDDWDGDRPRRRVYLGVVLTLLLAGAVYMAWRSGQLSAQRSDKGKPASATAAKDDTATNGANPNKNPDEPKSTPQAAKTVTQSTEKTQPPAAQPLAKTSPTPVRPEQPIQRISNVVSQTPAPRAFIDNGSEELAVAQRYLSGANGRRDSAQAAQWLWKSISKHNGEATVMLADLYLKGDGVSKNCDQARVLLDTAGRKGVPGAGQRLRNLQAFGCP